MQKGKYISEHSNGYQLRLKPTRFYPFSEWGGKKKALTAAQTGRSKRLLKMAIPHLSKENSRHPYQTMRRNKTGVVGIEFAVDPRRVDDDGAYKALGRVEGKVWGKSFAITKWGAKKAFQLACQARYQRNGGLSVLWPISSLPCRPTVPYYLKGVLYE